VKQTPYLLLVTRSRRRGSVYHSPIRLHRVDLHWLSAGTALPVPHYYIRIRDSLVMRRAWHMFKLAVLKATTSQKTPGFFRTNTVKADSSLFAVYNATRGMVPDSSQRRCKYFVFYTLCQAMNVAYRGTVEFRWNYKDAQCCQERFTASQLCSVAHINNCDRNTTRGTLSQQELNKGVYGNSSEPCYFDR
jgi:hypothetical protein